MTNDIFFDTLKVIPVWSAETIKSQAEQKQINFYYYSDGGVGNLTVWNKSIVFNQQQVMGECMMASVTN